MMVWNALTPDDWNAIWLSVKVALWAMFASAPFAIFVSYILAKKRFWGKTLLNSIVHLPLVMPPVVTGYLLLLTFGKQGFLGQVLADNLGLVFSFRWTGAALASAIMGFPLMVRAMRLSMEAIDPKLEQAAATLGANSFWVFVTVTLPLCLPGILAGMILSFAKAMGEFGATITFVSNIPGETQTLSSAIHNYLQVPDGDASAMRLTLIAITISFVALMISELLVARAHRSRIV